LNLCGNEKEQEREGVFERKEFRKKGLVSCVEGSIKKSKQNILISVSTIILPKNDIENLFR